MCLNFCKNVSEKCQYFPGNLSHFKNISLRNDSSFSLNVSEFSSEYVWEMSVFFWKDFWLYKKNWVWEIIVIFLLMCPSFSEFLSICTWEMSVFFCKCVWFSFKIGLKNAVHYYKWDFDVYSWNECDFFKQNSFYTYVL